MSLKFWELLFLEHLMFFFPRRQENTGRSVKFNKSSLKSKSPSVEKLSKYRKFENNSNSLEDKFHC